MEHSLDLAVRFYEMDPYGHVNHATYLQYFEVGRVSLLEEVGHRLDLLLERDAAMVIAQLATRFIAPARLGDIVTVDSGLSKMGRASATWLQRLRRGDEVIATQVARVGCTTRAGRPRRFPDDLVAALAPMAVDPGWLGAEAPRG